jgi:hypothetical protein
MRMRSLVVAHFKAGKSKDVVARTLDVSRRMLNKLHRRTNSVCKCGILNGEILQPLFSTAFIKTIILLGFSWITCQSEHPKRSQVIQVEFKKLQIETSFLIS